MPTIRELAGTDTYLLSFAQFEREIISERTRDKMSAARRKGQWVGGTPFLGYDVDPHGGRLVVNPAEAERVREIFTISAGYASLAAAQQEVMRAGCSRRTGPAKPASIIVAADSPGPGWMLYCATSD